MTNSTLGMVAARKEVVDFSAGEPLPLKSLFRPLNLDTFGTEPEPYRTAKVALKRGKGWAVQVLDSNSLASCAIDQSSTYSRIVDQENLLRMHRAKLTGPAKLHRRYIPRVAAPPHKITMRSEDLNFTCSQ
jgi:hypothetical protein